VSTITTKDGVEIFYKDWGKGQPIVFSHGWPLSAELPAQKREAESTSRKFDFWLDC
jgi:pimeloyl-ACP methyl ester carboxylesterase